MIAIDNSQVLTLLCQHCGCSGFHPSFSYVYSPSGNTVTVTDASTFDSGDTLKIANVTVTSKKSGLSVTGAITAAAGNVAVNVASLDATLGFDVKIVAVTNARCVDVAAAYTVGGASSLTGALGAQIVESEVDGTEHE